MILNRVSLWRQTPQRAYLPLASQHLDVKTRTMRIIVTILQVL